MAGSAQPDSDFQYDAFLSHSSENKSRVDRLAKLLSAAGVRVWYNNLDAGEMTAGAIQSGLDNSRVAVLCLSDAALKSQWVRFEWNAAISRDPDNSRRRFVPLLLETCVLPGSIGAFKHIDFREETDSALNELARLCTSAGPPRAVPAVPARPLSVHSVWPFTAISILLLALLNTGLFVANYLSPLGALFRLVVLTGIWSAVLTLSLQSVATLLILAPPYNSKRVAFGQQLLRFALPLWLLGIAFALVLFFGYVLYLWDYSQFSWVQDVLMVLIGVFLFDRWGGVRELAESRLESGFAKLRLEHRAAAVAAFAIAGMFYWGSFTLYLHGYSAAVRETLSAVNRVDLRWSADGRLVEATLAGLLFPTLCLLDAEPKNLRTSTEHRLAGRVQVLPNGDLTSASAKNIGCVAVTFGPHRRSRFEYIIPGRVDPGAVPQGRAIYCEAVAWRHKESAHDELEFDVDRSHQCALSSIYIVR